MVSYNNFYEFDREKAEGVLHAALIIGQDFCNFGSLWAFAVSVASFFHYGDESWTAWIRRNPYRFLSWGKWLGLWQQADMMES